MWLSKVVALVLCLCALVEVNGGPPIPARYDGFTKGSDGAPVHVEMFYDLLCPDCKASWPALKSAFEYLDQRKQVKITLHTFPLPYHRNAYLAAQAAHGLARNSTDQVYRWMETVFERQGDFGGQATETQSAVQVAKNMAGLSGRSEDELFSSASDGNTRVSFKYGCYRGVFGTPTYLVNGVPAPDEASGWSSKEWIDFIEQLGFSSVATLD